MTEMIKLLAYVLGILTLAIMLSFAVSADEIETALNATNNNSTSDALNGSISNDAQMINTSEELNQTLNLSTINEKPLDLVSISNIAKKAPDLAATASSSQIAVEPVGSMRIGNAIGGWNPFNPQHKIINSTKLGLPIKPMRDTEKMFFVCDIV